MGTETCTPRRPVSVMHFHGTADRIAPFGGGVGLKILPNIVLYSVEHTISAWVVADGCPVVPQTEDLPVRTQDCTSVQMRRYGPGTDGAEVVLFVIFGGGHTWPEGQSNRFLGQATHNVSANDRMWEFFQKHPLP
jgi:polyhydroxybutyrate depolymerase